MRRTAAPSKLSSDSKIARIDSLNHRTSDIVEYKSDCQTISNSNFDNYSRTPLSIDERSCRYFSAAYGKPSKKKHKTWEGDGFISITETSVKLLTRDGKEIGSSFKKQLSKVIFEEGAQFYIGGKFVEILSSMDNKPQFDEKETNTDLVSANIPLKSRGFVNREFKPVLNSALNKSNSAVTVAIDSEICPPVVFPRPPARHIFEYNKSCSSIRDVTLDPRLAARMRPHQIDGVIFLYECVLGYRSHGGTGAILADTMGLGKTIQTIALIWTLLNQSPYEPEPLVRRCIIVCPSSLVLNWKAEFDKWLGDRLIRPFCVSGDQKIEKYLESSVNTRVLILSYEMVLKSLEILQNIEFDLIVCDEAHRLKNTSIKTSMGMESLRVSRRVLLTGTPLQNDMEELLALVEFSNPGVLGIDRDEFRKRYIGPITAAREPGASQSVIEAGDEAASRLQRMTHSFILRRTELVNVRYLPPKDEFVIFCHATPMQIQLYKILIDCQSLQKHLESNTGGSATGGIDALSSILLLRKLCNDPIQFITHLRGKKSTNSPSENERESTMFDELNKSIEILSDSEEHWFLKGLLNGNTNPTNNKIYSGKLCVTASMLSSLKSNEKIVLVSHFTQTLNVLQNLCIDLKLKFHRIDGNTPTASRMRIVNEFNKISNNTPNEVLLLSCKAGGEGLNLIGASKILLYDPDWNPATDAQAMARVWRDGQQSRVSVYRLITTGTVEESLFQRQVAKQQLSTSIVDITNSDSKHTTFSKEELKNIFTLHLDSVDKNGCWTHELLNCHCHLESESITRNNSVERFDSRIAGNCQLGLKQMEQKIAPVSSIAQLNNWDHWIDQEAIRTKTSDNLILKAHSQISCVFMRTVNFCDDKQCEDQ